MDNDGFAALGGNTRESCKQRKIDHNLEIKKMIDQIINLIEKETVKANKKVDSSQLEKDKIVDSKTGMAKVMARFDC